MNVRRAYPRPVSCFASPDEVKRIDRMARRLREAEKAAKPKGTQKVA